ncbi:MAG TPA: hypothetical protein VFS67_34705, partial [Polyangiaceae bacterium]|nr:hypothetical protein [Polyangiaceae bacterium]
MFEPVYNEWLRRRWPWFLALVAGALVVGVFVLWRQAASRRAGPVDPAPPVDVLEVQIEAAGACDDPNGDSCSQRNEPPSVIAGALLQSWQGAPGTATALERAQSDAGGRARLELPARAEWVSIEAPGRARWSARLPFAR